MKMTKPLLQRHSPDRLGCSREALCKETGALPVYPLLKEIIRSNPTSALPRSLPVTIVFGDRKSGVEPYIVIRELKILGDILPLGGGRLP